MAPAEGNQALASKRLLAAERSLRWWSFAAEAVYMWLGSISLGVACFAAFSRGIGGILRQPSTALGFATVLLSVLCALVGWFQARGCRYVGRRCGVAATALGLSGSNSPDVPRLRDLQGALRGRQLTAWLGALFAVLGLQTMVGLLVTRVLTTAGGVARASGASLDVFTLLAVGNAALSHVLGGGFAAWQLSSLPLNAPGKDEACGGWGRP